MTTRISPPEGGLVEEPWVALGDVIRREDSPVVAREHDIDIALDIATGHFDPPADDTTEALFARLVRDRTVVVRERAPQ
jgi:hypothetical protein